MRATLVAKPDTFLEIAPTTKAKSLVVVEVDEENVEQSDLKELKEEEIEEENVQNEESDLKEE